jgi:P-type Ca2+ transporter type 2C
VSGGWHARPGAEVAAALGTDAERGLTAAEAGRRLARDGPNELARSAGPSPLVLLAAQFRSLVIWVLIGAAAISIALGDRLDGAAILAIVVLNAAIGFLQEFRAERALAALGRLTAPRARVVRDAGALEIPAREVVRGDLLALDAGDMVAADARLVATSRLEADEASLTGESQPVAKDPAPSAPDTPLAERAGMVFLGTTIAAGAGRALVVTTGMDTELGGIARMLQTAGREDTPLQRRLDAVGRRLLWACLAIVAIVFLLGLGRGEPVFELFVAAVSLAVAAVPEGLPAVVTIALALGVERMARRRALVRRLPAVETLGSTSVICTDKTGTLTLAQMTARRVVTADGIFAVSGEGWSPEGAVFADGAERTAADDPVLGDLLRAAVACSDAELTSVEDRPAVLGDPTEGALIVLAAKGGVRRDDVARALPRLATLPFDSERKRMTVVCRREGRPWAFVKGAPETILARCTHERTAHGPAPLGAERRAGLLEANALLAAEALRVLAVAERRLDAFPTGDDVESDLTLLGLVGLQDPPRPEVREAIDRCRRAGIRTVMITGDHPGTARAIARELGLLGRGDEAVTGTDVDRLDDAALAARVERIAVYARTTAEHKLRIVRAWKARGAVVAMTGDGVNDAPALKEASIGIAMGRTGTAVTKEAADMVITDDDFTSIVAAVEEGRGIWDNVVKTLGYLLAGNAGELGVMLVASLAGLPLPLLPIQLLWINLVTDGLPALALATDPIDAGVLDRPPRPPGAPVLDRGVLSAIALVGALATAAAFGAFAWELAAGASLGAARNAAFAVLVFAQLLLPFGWRHAQRTVAEVGVLSNLRLLAVVAVTFGLQLAIHEAPPLARVFAAEPLSPLRALAWGGLAAVPLAGLEARKLLRRARRAA